MAAEVSAHLDHLVIAATDLKSGVAWLEDRLGVRMQAGGEHAHFGTHNALLGLGDSYLEVIAVDPAAPVPGYPRWFGLGTPHMQERLSAGPALVHWVASVRDLGAALRLSPEDHGAALALSRGDNRWQLSVPPSGELPLGGVLPSLIEWAGMSPGARLPASGLRVEGLTLTTPDPARLRSALGALGFTGTPLALEKGPPRLEATLSMSGGVVKL